MPLDPYANCPCGSGKKFKWCCTGYFDKVEQALEMLQQSQFENAVRVMDALTKAHPEKPQVYGYYAHILFREGHIDRAEDVLETAFALEPNFPMGLLLKGLFRQSEGELVGALLWYRRASEAYPPEAHDQLSQVYEMIGRNELMLNRPLASRAAMALAVKYAPPDDTEVREQYEAIFGIEARMPDVVTKNYAFRPTAKPIVPPDAARLSDARHVYETLASQTPTDPAVWFNLGLVRAWQGEQPAALEAFNYSIESEWNDRFAQETAALAELMKFSTGTEQDSDYTDHRVFMQIRDANAVMQLLQSWEQEGRMIGAQNDESGTEFSCLLAEPVASLVETGNAFVKIVGNVQISQGVIRAWHVSKDAVDKIAEELRDRLNMAVSEPVRAVGIAQFGDLLQEALLFPARVTDPEDAEKKLQAQAKNYFENIWAQRQLKSLNGMRPTEANSSPLMRKRLLGIVRFLESIFMSVTPKKRQGNVVLSITYYHFFNLQKSLNIEINPDPSSPPAALLAAAEAAVAADLAKANDRAAAEAQLKATIEAAKVAQAAATQAAIDARKAAEVAAAEAAALAAIPAKRDFSTLTAEDLAQVNRDELSIAELEDGMRTSFKLDAKELAVAFARTAIGKPPEPGKPDRYPLYLCAIQGAIAEGNVENAIQISSEGVAFDSAQNEGKRANDFALQRGKLFARKGDTEQATQEFDGLIARSPDEAKYYITAIETMLSAKQPDKALHFSELGLAKARSSGNRDLEGACMELSEAARRMK